MRLTRASSLLVDYVGALSTATLLGARWAIDVPEIEAKIFIGRHLYEDALAADQLRERLAALGVNVNPSSMRQSSFLGLLVDASHALTTDEKLGRMYERTKRSLLTALAIHLRSAARIVDEPTIELLENIERRLALQVAGARHVAERVASISCARVSELETLPALTCSSDEVALNLQTPASPARDPRFGSPAATAAALPDLRDGEFVPVLLHSNLMDLEIPSIEACSRSILDFHHTMPWAFIVDMALQCRDEARHAEALLVRYRELGGELGRYPSSNRLWEMATGQPLEVRLGVHQRIGERTGVDGALWLARQLESAGDERTATIFEYVAQDEIAHVGYGTKWMTYVTGSHEGLREAHLRAQDRRHQCTGKASSGPLVFPLNADASRRAGFLPEELAELQDQYEQYGSVHRHEKP